MRAIGWIAVGFASLAVTGCGSSGDQGGAGGSAAQGGSQTGMGGQLFTSSPSASAGPSSGSGIPMNFVAADIGAYALGKAIMGDGVTDTGVNGDNGCNILVGVVRDFKGANEPGGHPDFEAFSGDDATPNLVEMTLGADLKPVYAGHCETPNDPACPYGQQMTSKAAFDQWYRYTQGVNMPYLVYFQFTMNGNVSTFASSHFFPLDNAGFGNSGKANDKKDHNFHFTTELHTQFKYQGGEVFTFTGDDDLWVFINSKLAIDLGGLHPAAMRMIDIDQAAAGLGITPGNVYPLELFHAERHTNASNFRVDTNLAFVDCGTIPPDVK